MDSKSAPSTPSLLWIAWLVLLVGGVVVWGLDRTVASENRRLEALLQNFEGHAKPAAVATVSGGQKSDIAEPTGRPVNTTPLTPEEDAELSRLRGDHSGLTHQLKELEKKVAQLDKKTPQLEPLEKDRDALKATLAQVTADRGAGRGVARVASDSGATANACIANLKQMESAKEQWGLENRQTAAAIPVDTDLYGPDRYIRVKPACPRGGVYNLGPLSQRPTCSHPGHTL